MRRRLIRMGWIIGPRRCSRHDKCASTASVVAIARPRRGDRARLQGAAGRRISLLCVVNPQYHGLIQGSGRTAGTALRPDTAWWRRGDASAVQRRRPSVQLGGQASILVKRADLRRGGRSDEARASPSKATGVGLAKPGPGRLACSRLRRAFSSVAQSGGLLSRRSVVQIHERPPTRLAASLPARADSTPLAQSLQGWTKQTANVPIQADRFMSSSTSAGPVASEERHRLSAPLALEAASFGDRELDDLIFSWRRVSDPKLRRIALELLRSMAS